MTANRLRMINWTEVQLAVWTIERHPMTLDPKDMAKLQYIRQSYVDLIDNPNEPPAYGRVNMAYRESVPYLIGLISHLMDRLETLSPPVDSIHVCDTCRYFWGVTNKSGVMIGHCKRFPPRPILKGSGIVDVLPTVEQWDNCGEWSLNDNLLEGEDDDEDDEDEPDGAPEHSRAPEST